MTNSQDETITTWIGGDGAWTDAASWSDGVPTDTEVAAFAADTTESVQGDGVAGQVAVAGTVSLSGAVSVSGALSLSGTSTLSLGATAMLQAAGAVSVDTTATLTDHGTLETAASVIHGTVVDDGSWSVDGALEISGGVVIAKAGGRIETTGGVRVDGGGTVELGPTTFVSGGFTLDHGTLAVGPGSGTADAPATVTIERPLMLEGDSDSLSLQASDTLVINGSIMGSVSDGLQLKGSGTVVLNGDNSFSGGVVIGTHAELLLNSATAAGTGSISFVAGTPASDKPLATPVGGVLGGTVALLDGMDLSGSNFGLGDGIDLRDLSLHTASTSSAASVTADYDATTGKLVVYQGGARVATLTLPAGLDGLFSVARDGQGGTTLTLMHDNGDAIATATRSTAANQLYGVTGTGVTVGVISDSFNAAGGLAQDSQDGALPGTVDIVDDVTSGGGTDEGRAMAQLIHDIAPGAAIAFASPSGAGGSDATIANAINNLVNAKVSVIVDDLGDGPGGFYTLGSQTSAAIQNAIDHHIVVITSATNKGDVFYENTLNATATTLPDQADRTYAFDFGDTGTGDSTSPFLQEIKVQSNQVQHLDLQWQSSDITLTAHFYVKQADGQYTSVNIPNSASSGAPKYTFAQTNNGLVTYYMAITSTAAAPTGLFKYTIGDEAATPSQILDSNAEKGSGTISGHQLDPNEITVAAASYTTTLPGQTPTVESFSAGGPGLLVQADGSLAVQSKPDITAPDGTSTTVTDPSADTPDGVGGLATFYGTSAAAPAFAGVAALMLQADSGLTSADLLNLAKDSALSMADPTRTGAGLVQADLAVGYAEGKPIEQFAGGNTTLLGTSGNDMIVTNDGATTVDGGAGSDTVQAGGQSTSIIGGSGTLLVTVASGSVSLSAGSGSATVTGGSGDLLLGGSAGHNSLTGGGGGAIWGGGAGDLLAGGAGDLIGAAAFGNATLVGSTGNLLLDADRTLAFTGNNATLFGTASGRDTVVGTGFFQDVERGGETTVFGGAGGNVVWAGASQVTDVAGTGQGTLIVGTGHADLWIDAASSAQTVFALDDVSGGSVDVIGFRPGVDRFASANYVAGSGTATVQNGSLSITLADHTSITFLDVATLT